MKFVHTADTHLGFDTTKTNPCHPEGRKKRARSVFQNFLTIVQYAMEAEADLFIHSGDLFNKHYIPREKQDELARPLLELAGTGMRVLIIPGNHERSRFPFDLFQGAVGVYVFDRPKCLSFHLDGYSVGLAGFPFIRENSRGTFLNALKETEYEGLRSDFNVLVTHQAFDQASVGPIGFTFKAGRRDTVARHSIPLDFDYVAAGHIHRYQILNHPLKPAVQFVYPGSIQRMSFAEMYEEKGFIVGEVMGDRIETRFISLPVYEMEIVEIQVSGLTRGEAKRAITEQFWRFDEDRVLRFNLVGGNNKGDYPDIDFEGIRATMPPVLECQFALKTGKRWVLR